MSLLGKSIVPPSADARWAEWARPLLALVRLARRTNDELLRFASAHGANETKAMNLLSWLLNENLVRPIAPGIFVVTDYGRTWLGSYELAPGDVRFAAPILKPTGRAAARPLINPAVFDGVPRGRLTPVRPAPKDRHGNTCVVCECACDGREVVVRLSRLEDGTTKSCGCLQRRGRRRARQHSEAA